MKVSQLTSFIWRTCTRVFILSGSNSQISDQAWLLFAVRILEVLFSGCWIFSDEKQIVFDAFFLESCADLQTRRDFRAKGRTHLKFKSKNFVAVSWKHAIFSSLSSLLTVQFMFNLQQALLTLRIKSSRRTLQLKKCLLSAKRDLNP